MNITKSDTKRFWNKVDTSGRYWEWTAYKGREGYGEFTLGDKSIKAHRFSYAITNGPISEGLFICHHCDNPSCVKPSHLFMGTQTDNMRDAIAKGRVNVQGENNGRSKLVENDVHEIRRLWSLGVEQQLIAKMWQISKVHTNHIIKRKKWKHI